MKTIDFYVAPVFILVICMVAMMIRNRLYPEGHPLREYLMKGLMVKLVGAFFTGVIYYYYYGYGDSIWYYKRVVITHMLLEVDPVMYWKLIFVNVKSHAPELYRHIVSVRGFDTSQFMVVRIASVLAIPVFNIYTGIAFLFAALSFSGVWALFATFYDINPKLKKEFAVSCLFIPSVIFWGSGLFKDTVALGFTGWFTYATYMVFIKRKNLLFNVAMLIVSFNFIYVIKAYIIMAFIPAIAIWVFYKYRDKIKNDFMRTTATPVMLVLGMVAGLALITRLGGSGEYWSLDKMGTRAKDMQWWHKEVKNLYGETGGGSFYSIGSGDFSVGNIIRSFPLAVNVTLFRPYLWEVRNPIMLMSAIESLILFIFTLRIIFNVGLRKLARLIVSNPEIFFALSFSMIFAFAVGFTSFNFGALVRYKIPCIPFYVMALFMLRHHANILKKEEALAAAEK